MVPTLTGMMVARTIPEATRMALKSGLYTLHGGVIRRAAGTPGAGQIVAHLLPAADAAAPLLTGAGIVIGATVAVGAIGAVVGAGFGIANYFQSKRILQAVHATMQVAELNLAATQAGFAALDRRLIALEQTLRSVEQTVTDIQNLLESAHRAELRAALEHLEKLPSLRDERVRIELLTHSATMLGKLRHLYFERMYGGGRSVSLVGALAAEEYYLIAVLGQVRCYAELREPAMARQVLSESVEQWRGWARRLATGALIGSYPERFLAAEFVEYAPLPLLAAWLDFALDKQEGLGWIEVLRTKTEPWYYHRALNGEPRELRRSDTLAAQDSKLAHDRDRVIPTLNKLLARDGVLQSHIAQYELMEQHNLTPGELEESLQALALEEAGEESAMLVLLPDTFVA